jgi:succinyl-CoA synthetase beta subunit
VAIARGLASKKIVVKAQIHAGGRGKGTFTNGLKGGVQVASSPEEAGQHAERMLGQTLVTHHTVPVPAGLNPTVERASSIVAGSMTSTETTSVPSGVFAGAPAFWS